MSPHKKTILVVDDDKMFTLYFSILLKRMGFNVLTAADGSEALDLIRRDMPDLVTMDVQMPVKDGLDTLAAVRSDEALRCVPVFMVSGEPDEDVVRKCEKAGSDGFLPKPVPMNELHELLQDFVFTSNGFRRRHLRVHSRIKVMVLKEGSAQEMNTESLSEGGVYLHTDKPFPVGTEVEVVLPLDGGTVRLKGAVVYTRGRYDDKIPIQPGMAVEFTDISEPDNVALCGIVSELMTGDVEVPDPESMVTMSGEGDPCSKRTGRRRSD